MKNKSGNTGISNEEKELLQPCEFMNLMDFKRLEIDWH